MWKKCQLQMLTYAVILPPFFPYILHTFNYDYNYLSYVRKHIYYLDYYLLLYIYYKLCI